jgi:SAM-dependent methyltransferase
VREAIIRMLGWRLLLITGDPCVLDRWLWLRRHLRSGSLRTLDAGAGNGAFSMYAARIGNSVVAASFSAEELERARRRAATLGVTGVDFRVLDLRELDSQRAALGKFDQIICPETIEHLRDDEGLVRGLAQMLEPRGRAAADDAVRRPPAAVHRGARAQPGRGRLARALRLLANARWIRISPRRCVDGVARMAHALSRARSPATCGRRARAVKSARAAGLRPAQGPLDRRFSTVGRRLRPAHDQPGHATLLCGLSLAMATDGIPCR